MDSDKSLTKSTSARHISESELEPGDIGACIGGRFAGYLQPRLIAPETDRIHYLILWKQYKNDDWIILESIGKGLAIGLLSWYSTTHVEFYRVNCPKELRVQAPLNLVEYGRSYYDYLLVVRIVLDLIGHLFRMVRNFEFRKLRAEDFSYSRGNALICTEAVDVAYLTVGVSIVGDVLPLPSAFKQAELDGVLTYLGDNGFKPAKIKEKTKKGGKLCYTPGKIITEGCRTQKTESQQTNQSSY